MNLCRILLDDLQWYRKVERRRFLLSALFSRYYWIVAVYRLGFHARRCRIPGLRELSLLLYHMLNAMVFITTGADVRAGAVIGRRFTIHASQGVLIADDVRIGDHCTVNTGVCIVNRANFRGEGVPTLGDYVRIGVGGKVMGGIQLGDHVHVGANAVVIKDVPAYHLAVGVPAVNKPRTGPLDPDYLARAEQDPDEIVQSDAPQ
jgi:serine O-acetyltransferase